MESCEWWLTFLRGPATRTFYRPRREIDLLIHTDASLVGLGVAVFDGSVCFRRFYSERPRDLSDASSVTSRIYVLELYAALLGALVLKSIVSQSRGLNVVVGIDNNAALVALLKGHGSCPLASRIVGHFWSAFSESKSLVWVDRVRSSANKADMPSRQLGRTPDAVRLRFPRV